MKRKQPDDLVFTGVKGCALRPQVFQRSILTNAATELGLAGLHPHELPHTAASPAIAAGADVKVVQQMLGHKSATMTLDLRTPLRGPSRHRRGRSRRGVAQLLPTGKIVDLEKVREMTTPPVKRGV